LVARAEFRACLLLASQQPLVVLTLPQYSRPPKAPRPRPLTYGDFQLLVSPDNIGLLEAADRDDVGVADIWLTQAFQGGRISETLKLRLGCVGLVGTAQPYLWRDISKVNVVDYGMPCYLPVGGTAASRDPIGFRVPLVRGRRGWRAARRAVQNPDLVVEISQVWFRNVWVAWLERLGLKGTHQTRATLATSLLNNGAPAALVRQLLGHFSPESLAHYANYNNDSMTRHLQQVWTAGPGMDKPGTILLRPTDVNTDDPTAAAARIDLTVVPVEHGLCRYGPVHDYFDPLFTTGWHVAQLNPTDQQPNNGETDK
jgi:integrase